MQGDSGYLYATYVYIRYLHALRREDPFARQRCVPGHKGRKRIRFFFRRSRVLGETIRNEKCTRDLYATKRDEQNCTDKEERRTKDLFKIKRGKE